ncbi:MAG: hypothetical protein GXP29_15045 [Planctomycetes bacterium]|nr:hypothetical protein [Planctomycetota bacterium]
MSLRTFHIIFVVVSTLMTVGVGVWAMLMYRTKHEQAMLVMAGLCGVGVVVLLWYGRWFLRKLKVSPL